MFIAYEVGIQLVQSLRPLVAIVEQTDRDLGDQLRRAASSVVLDLAEGQRSAKGERTSARGAPGTRMPSRGV